MNRENSNFLECIELKKNFRLKNREIKVLKCIDFSIKKGEIIVIIGKSGSGKSTLLSLLGGLERPTQGSIYFKGKSFSEMSNEELALLRGKEISMICQNFNLIPSWNAFNNVEAALIQKNMGKEERIDKIENLFSKIGLEGRLENLPSELSEGEQQRVAFARAMIAEPELIIADEPTGDVDPETAKELIKILFNFLIDNKVNLIVSTNMEFLVHAIQNKKYLERELNQITGNMYILSDGVLHHIDNFREILEKNLIMNGGNFYEKYI